MTCKNCKHWNVAGSWHRALEGERRLLSAVEQRGFRVCSLGVTGIDAKNDPTMPDRPFYPESLALAIGDEGIALLHTHPDFGCVQFERRG